MDSLTKIKTDLQAFAAERDWSQFHSPKNLAMALAGETGELLEHFQWLTEQQSRELSPDQLEQVAEEVADIQLYLILLADKLGVDILEEAHKKIKKNAAKYPVSKAKGKASKYTDL